MATLNELVYDLWESVRSIISDDDDLDIRKLAFWIRTQRAKYLRQEFNKPYRVIDDRVVQNLGAVPLEVVDSLFISGVALPISKKIMRTTILLPNTIEQYIKPTFTRIGSLDITDRKFSFIDYSKAPFVGNGRFNSKEFFVFLMERRLYVISNQNNHKWKGLQYINIQGVFEDPIEVENLKKLIGTRDTYYDWNEYYPLGDWIWPFLKDEIHRTDLKEFIVPKDSENNASQAPITE